MSSSLLYGDKQLGGTACLALSFLLSSSAFTFSGWSVASDQALLGSSHLVVMPETHRVSEYVIITGFLPSQIDSAQAPMEESGGLPAAMRIDYHPFENRFNMTASLAQTPVEQEERSIYFNDSTYLGVGWQQLSEDAVLDLRMDVGAVYKPEAVTVPSSVKVIRKERFSQSETSGQRWQTVISVGVSYKF